MLRIGFSSLVCPAWDLDTIVKQASAMGFDGVELRGVRGELDLTRVQELAGFSDVARRLFEEAGVELVCLAASATLDSRDRRHLARQKQSIIENMELAAKLGCPYVRIYMGEVQRRDNARAALGRIAEALVSLADVAGRLNVTLLVENGGDFAGSEALWFVVDAAGHPAVQACWNQCTAMTLGERATNSIPRLGSKIRLVHVCDAEFDESGILLEYKRPGQGGAEVGRQIELLKGMVFDGYLVFEWPKLWVPSLPEPEAVLPDVAAYLRERIADQQLVLSAYKGDKNAPKLAVLG